MPASPIVRRDVLQLLGGSAGFFLAGCLGSGQPSAPSSPTTEGTATEERETPVPGRGEPLTIQKVVDSDTVEYIESSDSVRFVARWRHVNHEAVENGSEAPTREPVYETVPYEEWAPTECAHVGASAVFTAIEQRLDEQLTGIAVGVTTRDDEKVIVVHVETLLDRDGSVVSTPSADFDEVRGVAPSGVQATISLDSRNHSCNVSVLVSRATIQYN